MIYAFDTYYVDDIAKTVCVGFKNWQAVNSDIVYEESLPVANDYQSGEFYKRELPCIMSLIGQIPLMDDDVLVVDGYVTLGADGRLGLGGHLYKSLDERYAVVGVAKNEFAAQDDARRMVLRGNSQKPLFVTTLGIGVDEVATYIQTMQGDYRIPTLLKLLDQRTRA